MAKIKLTSTTFEVFAILSDGNQGALSVIMEIKDKAKVIDPQAACGWWGALLGFDTYENYGTEIYILFNDQCNRDVSELLMLMRAVQLGLIAPQRVRQIAADQTRQNLLTQKSLMN